MELLITEILGVKDSWNAGQFVSESGLSAEVDSTALTSTANSSAAPITVTVSTSAVTTSPSTPTHSQTHTTEYQSINNTSNSEVFKKLDEVNIITLISLYEKVIILCILSGHVGIKSNSGHLCLIYYYLLA